MHAVWCHTVPDVKLLTQICRRGDEWMVLQSVSRQCSASRQPPGEEKPLVSEWINVWGDDQWTALYKKDQQPIDTCNEKNKKETEKYKLFLVVTVMKEGIITLSGSQPFSARVSFRCLLQSIYLVQWFVKYNKQRVLDWGRLCGKCTTKKDLRLPVWAN